MKQIKCINQDVRFLQEQVEKWYCSEALKLSMNTDFLVLLSYWQKVFSLENHLRDAISKLREFPFLY